MRSFIAIELPEEIKKHLNRLQQELKSCGADVKWVEPANIHLTLKFLGEIDEQTRDAVAAAMQDVAAKHKGFACSLGAVGAFPRPEAPRVIWIGLDAGDNEVKDIASGLEERLSCAGIPREDRPFSSHITLGRTRSAVNIRLLGEKLHASAASTLTAVAAFRVEKIYLFKSTLTPHGPIYGVIREASLQK